MQEMGWRLCLRTHDDFGINTFFDRDRHWRDADARFGSLSWRLGLEKAMK